MWNAARFVALALIFTLSFGCAGTTSKLDIDARNAYVPSLGYPHNAPTVYVQDINDVRIFTNGTGNPADPTPEITSAAEREITIGRKRNGFGKAWGAIELKDGLTVKKIIRAVIADSLAESGFNVIHEFVLAKKDTVIIDVNITKFWLWTDMGFWQGHLVTDIATMVKTQNGEIQIAATERLGIQMGTDSNAMKSVHNAIGKFRIEAREKFALLKIVPANK